MGKIIDAIKPKDFLEQIPKPDMSNILKRKKPRKGRDAIPYEEGFCSSCLFCRQDNSAYQCMNSKSKNYGYSVVPDDTCGLYLADHY